MVLSLSPIPVNRSSPSSSSGIMSDDGDPGSASRSVVSSPEDFFPFSAKEGERKEKEKIREKRKVKREKILAS